MKRNLILTVSTLVIMLASCNKDHTNGDTNNITGTYKLQSVSAKTNSTLTTTDGEKEIMVSEYTGTNNAGTIVVDGARFSATGLSYEVNSTATAYYYQDNELIDSFSMPFNVKIPASNSVAPYKLIGTDSIYFSQGSFASPLTADGTTQTAASGGKYTMSGNILTIKQSGSKDSTFSDSGVTFHMVETVLATIVLEKQ